MREILLVEGFNDWNTWYKDGRVRVDTLTKEKTYQNQCVILKGTDAEDVGLVKGEHVQRIRQYFPSGISPKNTEQKLALSLLKDKTVPLKILSGVAGSGKTLLACAHAVEQFKKGDKSKIVIAKSMTPVGREIGFLKGDMYEKIRPWLGPFYDNMINCGVAPYELDKWIEQERIEVTPITFIQGRSIRNAIIIIDEAQNLDVNILKQIITRAAEGSEIILLGDHTQVFERLREDSLNIIIEKGRNSEVVGAVYLDKSLRSPLADWAVKNL